MTEPAHLRIGALSRRVGVSPELLRAWEQRYGLLQPVRSAGGFRLYSSADEDRVRSMRRHLDAGVSAAQAARLALTQSEPAGGHADAAAIAELAAELRSTLDRLDEPGAHATFDRLLAAFTLQTVLRDVVLPYLQELGQRWQRGEASVAQEHFASNVLRGRLLGLARGWGEGAGPRAVLACVPGELHDLPLIMFGLVLARHGWRVTYLGPDTPIATLRQLPPNTEPRLVVVAAATHQRFEPVQAQLAALARDLPVAVAGSGASTALADAVGGSLLEGDPVSAAERVASEGR
jgi:MerR family transcriptional regulator, light-induced transcriptional regulator